MKALAVIKDLNVIEEPRLGLGHGSKRFPIIKRFDFGLIGLIATTDYADFSPPPTARRAPQWREDAGNGGIRPRRGVRARQFFFSGRFNWVQLGATAAQLG